MNKKIVSLLLAMIMMLTMLAGCSDTSNNSSSTDSTDRVPMTLSLWLPTDENTTAEAIEAVEAQLSRLCEARYETKIELHLIPRDEYVETINRKMEETRRLKQEAEEAEEQRIKEAKKNGGQVETVATEEQPVETDKYGRPTISYPEVEDKQLDIFLVKGYEEYIRLRDEEYILNLSSELSGSSKILTTYIYPTFFDVVDDFGIYAIPNNHPVGEYQYFLVNKALVEEYDYNPQRLLGPLQCRAFLKDIGSMNLEGVVPLLAKVESANIVSWGADPGEFSILSSQIANSMTYSSDCPPNVIFADTGYNDLVAFNKELEELGYVGDGTLEEDEIFAAGVVSGTPYTIKEYEEDYYIYTYASPMFTEEDIYGSMFAVSECTADLSRSMEIITYLNTDVEVRTVLQYGAEDIHWEYEDDMVKDTIRIISDDYSMDLLETGNVYMTYPGEGIGLDYWEYGKQQNLDSCCSPYIKFSGYVTDENRELLEEIDRLSKEYKERMDALTYKEYAAAAKKMNKELQENETVMALLDPENKSSIKYIYTEWRETLYAYLG